MVKIIYYQIKTFRLGLILFMVGKREIDLLINPKFYILYKQLILIDERLE